MHSNDKIPKQLHQDVVYQWTCTKENCNSSYIGESSKEHNTSSMNAIFQHCTTNNHPEANIIDQDRKQVLREDRDAIHITRNNLALNHNVGKLNIPKKSLTNFRCNTQN